MPAANKIVSLTGSQTPVIEQGVPLPSGVRGSRTPLNEAVQALAAAPVGSSVLIPTAMAPNGPCISERLHRLGGKGWAAIRKAEGGYRVWKTAEPKLR